LPIKVTKKASLSGIWGKKGNGKTWRKVQKKKLETITGLGGGERRKKGGLREKIGKRERTYRKGFSLQIAL